MASTRDRVPIESQRVDAPLTRSATFLVLSVSDDPNSIQTVRSTLSDVSGLIKNVAFRDLDAHFACTVGIGGSIWSQLTKLPKPAELHPFPTIKGQTHTAISTPGDLLFHIRSERRDLCFEFERQLMDSLGPSVKLVDSTVGFRYFDVRDLLGFVDGTANPVGPAVPDSVLVTATEEQQEAIIGRKKLENTELDDADADQQKAHKQLATVEEDGTEFDILRDNMPFGSPSAGEFGTYFIGYSRRLWVIEKMLQRMFVGDPPGLHDRILNYSKAVMGSTFFAPNAEFLAGLDG